MLQISFKPGLSLTIFLGNGPRGTVVEKYFPEKILNFSSTILQFPWLAWGPVPGGKKMTSALVLALCANLSSLTILP